MSEHITDEQLQNIVQMIDNYFGIEVNERYVQKIIEDDTQLVLDIVHWGYMDTVVRDTIANKMSHDLIGCSWPLNIDGSSDGFFKKLKVAANDQGFSTIWDE